MRMSPTRPARTLTVEEFAELWAQLQALMRQAVGDGRIITVEAENWPRMRGVKWPSRRWLRQRMPTATTDGERHGAGWDGTGRELSWNRTPAESGLGHAAPGI